jgi:GTPase SAR1 family protein
MEGSGKASFLNALFKNEYIEETSRPYVSVQRYKIKGSVFLVYDIPNGKKTRSKWDHYFRKADALIFLINSHSTDEECDDAKNALMSLLYRNMWAKRPMLVIGTKNDLPDAVSCRELVLKLDLVSIIDREIACFSISSKNMDNIDLVYNWIMEQSQRTDVGAL